MLLDRCPICLSVLSMTLVYCGPHFRPMSVVIKWPDESRCHLVGLVPGHIVLDGDQPPGLQRGTAPPNFRLMSTVAKRLHGSRYHLVGM